MPQPNRITLYFSITGHFAPVLFFMAIFHIYPQALPGYSQPYYQAFRHPRTLLSTMSTLNTQLLIRTENQTIKASIAAKTYTKAALLTTLTVWAKSSWLF
jgi:hypothetical protein